MMFLQLHYQVGLYFPVLTPPLNAVETAIPRSIFYPQSEINLNKSIPGQKANLQTRIFWDTP